MTGSNTGVGKEVARILYSKNAKVYMTARSEDKARLAIQDIEKTSPQSQVRHRWPLLSPFGHRTHNME